MRNLRQSKVRKILAYSLVVLMLAFTFSCFREYYKVQKSDVGELQEQADTRFRGKYFVIHQNDMAYHFKNLVVGEESISGNLAPLPWDHQFYQLTNLDEPNRYRGKSEKQVLDEVHLWLKPEPQILSLHPSSETLIVPENMIQDIHVYKLDGNATTVSHLVGILGIAGTITAVVLIINEVSSTPEPSPPPLPMTKESSCPFVYIFDGTQYQLMGEAFPGAMLPNLERDDYLPLPGIRPVGDHYRVRLSNELMENQFIDLTELLVVNHPAEESVLLDQDGGLHFIAQPEAPLRAWSAEGRNLVSTVTKKDSVPFLFDDRNTKTSTVKMAFSKPAGTDVAKLILRAKNSYWLDLLWYDFSRKYGSWYDRWAAENGSVPSEEVKAWMTSQHFPLSIYLRTGEEWEKITELPMAGPVAARDLIVPVDLREHSEEEVQLCLETGFLFWELDYAAMDFTVNRALTRQVLQPTKVMFEGVDEARALTTDDGFYLHQPPKSAPVEIWFPGVTIKPGESQSVFLKSNGYYEAVRDFRGLPDVLTLWSFNREGHFPDFSKKQFERFLESMDVKIGAETPSGL